MVSTPPRRAGEGPQKDDKNGRGTKKTTTDTTERAKSFVFKSDKAADVVTFSF
jgi:hypothetical protein